MSKMKEITSKSSLAIELSKLEGFEQPKVRVEQYPADSEIAADTLWQAFYRGDIKGKNIADLGAGTGILGLGALLLGAKEVYFIENDPSALEIAKKNYKKLKSEYKHLGKAIFLLQDIAAFTIKMDVILQNPPFGTKVRHADKVFLEKAVTLAPVIYSFHKSTSEKFIKAFSTDNGFKITHKTDYQFPLKATQKFHKSRIKRIEVSLWRLEQQKNETDINK